MRVHVLQRCVRSLNDNEKHWFHNNLKQNEAQSACAGLTYKGVN